MASGDQLYLAKNKPSSRKLKKKKYERRLAGTGCTETLASQKSSRLSRRELRKAQEILVVKSWTENIQAPSLRVLNTQRGKYKPKEASDRMIKKTLSPEQTLIQRRLTNRPICATLNTNLNCS